jgi:uncharacterized delta-60 repeat protein
MARHHQRRSRRLYLESLESRQMLTGSLDNTFSGDGMATPTAGLGDFDATDVAMQPDGKAVIVGSVPQFNPIGGFALHGAVTRLLYDGQRDPSFGGGAPVVLPSIGNLSEGFSAVAIAPDGKIVAVGLSRINAIDTSDNDRNMLVARFNTDGSLDSSFSGDGGVVLDVFNDGVGLNEGFAQFDVAVQGDGKIVVVGTEMPGGPDSAPEMVVVRLRSSGALDRDLVDPLTGQVFLRGFAVDGVQNVGFGGNDFATSVKLDNAGNIFVGGSTSSAAGEFGGLLKLDSFGSLVTTFSGDGKMTFQIPGNRFATVKDLILQGDKIIVAGKTRDTTTQFDFFTARITAVGLLDTTFGEQGQGFTVTDLGDNDLAESIVATSAIGLSGFVVSGGSFGVSLGSGGMAAAKYSDNGLLDTSFGSGGKVRLSFGASAHIAAGPGRRVTLAGGADFAAARLLLNGAKGVTATTGDPLAVEGTTNTATFFVGRTENLPVPTRVFFGIGGTASYSSTRTGARDYTMSGMVLPTIAIGGVAYVDIPANQTFVLLTFTTVNDSLREGNETASFTIVASSNYEIGSPGSGTITIQDDDTPDSRIGTTTVAMPSKHVDVDEELQAAVTWTVPSGGWRQLSTIQLRLRDIHDDDAFSVLTFDEATNSFSLESSGAGASPVGLVLSKCTFQAAGPTAPTVKVIFTFRFNAAAEKRRFALDVAATNDMDAFSGFAQVGEFLVHKKKTSKA